MLLISLLFEEEISISHIEFWFSYNKYFKADLAAILNLDIDHLDRHKNISQYANAKVKLICDQKKNKIALVEKDSLIINNLINGIIILAKLFQLMIMDVKV